MAGHTLAELWSMAEGRKQIQREMLMAQAGLLFFDGSPEDLETFIRTGRLEATQSKPMLSTVQLEAMQRATDKRRAKSGRVEHGKRK